MKNVSSKYENVYLKQIIGFWSKLKIFLYRQEEDELVCAFVGVNGKYGKKNQFYDHWFVYFLWDLI
jgi:hypothetical protein